MSFPKNDDDLGRTGLTKHKIDVGNSTPIRQPIRVPPLARREEAANAIRVMQEQGVIEPSHSPWASPVVLVRKKGRQYSLLRGLQEVKRCNQKRFLPSSPSGHLSPIILRINVVFHLRP